MASNVQPPADMLQVAKAIGAAVVLDEGCKGLIDLRPAGSGRWVAQLRIKNARGKEGAPGYYEVTRGRAKRITVKLLGADGRATFEAVPHGNGWYFSVLRGG